MATLLDMKTFAPPALDLRTVADFIDVKALTASAFDMPKVAFHPNSLTQMRFQAVADRALDLAPSQNAARIERTRTSDERVAQPHTQTFSELDDIACLLEQFNQGWAITWKGALFALRSGGPDHARHVACFHQIHLLVRNRRIRSR